jgi:hypothetical protein
MRSTEDRRQPERRQAGPGSNERVVHYTYARTHRIKLWFLGPRDYPEGLI